MYARCGNMRQFSGCARVVRQLAQVREETVFEPDFLLGAGGREKKRRWRSDARNELIRMTI
jgi:hypothetical protein